MPSFKGPSVPSFKGPSVPSSRDHLCPVLRDHLCPVSKDYLCPVQGTICAQFKGRYVPKVEFLYLRYAGMAQVYMGLLISGIHRATYWSYSMYNVFMFFIVFVFSIFSYRRISIRDVEGVFLCYSISSSSHR